MHEQIEMDRPLDRAVNAIEHVIRHQGAPHLRPASCRFSLWQRESVDVFFCIFLTLMAFAYLSYRFLRFSVSKALTRSKISQLKKTQ